MRNYLTIAGTDSRDFGVYISGQGTFSAPEKAYEFYSVPGRNGAILGNDNRLENIEVSYNCFIYSNFNQNIAEFRTFLLSLNGYQRLTDSYHPDEYRMAVYTGPFEPEVTEKNDAGSFVLTFNCKPQRFLTSGDTVYKWVPGGAQTLTGSELNVLGDKLNTSVLTADCDIKAVTDPPAYNILPYFQYIGIYINSAFVTAKKVVNNTSTDFPTSGTVDLIAGTCSATSKLISLTGLTWTGDYTYKVAYTSISGVSGLRDINPLPYAYPVVDATSASSQSDVFTLLSGYQRAAAWWSGKLYLKDYRITSASSLSFVVNEINNNQNASADVVLTSPESYTFTPYTPNYPSDFFTIKAVPDPFDSEYSTDFSVDISITMEYLPDTAMDNPTMFPSEPLIRAYGSGSFTMNSITVTISSCTSYVDIDCELMDCYEGATNRNNNVTFSTYDFPKLQPGLNPTTINSGISYLEITPRWWRV